MRLGRVAKLTDTEIDAVREDTWEDCPELDERDRTAILWADRVTRNLAGRDAAARARLERSFSEAEQVELTLVIGLFALLNRFNDSLWMDLDDGAPPHAVLSIPPDAFRRYAATMYR